MIHLITGQPGAGKTLYALHYVQALAEGKREIYYEGITDLKLPWVQMDDSREWFKLPPGSIVVIDECQRIFRPRGNGAAVPEYVSQLETHRHQGIDLVLITQHPMLCDNNVRRLTGRHFHVVRTFGMARATVHEWTEVRVDCDKRRSDSVRHAFTYPVDSFAWYKSAEVHTHKRRIPMRVYFLFTIPVIMAAIGYGMYRWFEAKMNVDPSKELLKGQAPASRPGVTQWGPGGTVPVSRTDRTMNAAERQAEYIRSHVPAIPGLAYTASRYDEVTKPKVAPIPAACVSSASKGCRCYSQQGTRMADVPDDICQSIVANGFFVDWQDPQKVRVASAAVPAPVSAQGAVAPVVQVVQVPVPVAGPAAGPVAVVEKPFTHIRSGGLTPQKKK